MRIRPEALNDAAAIRAIHLASFPAPAEADLVDQLRKDGDIAISLVSDAAGCVTGHVLFSRMAAPFPALGLGPVAVIPEWRGRGIAARLIEDGLARARREDWVAVFVLGDPAYYGRFGFEVALAAGFQSPYAGPHFMARALKAPLPVRDGPVAYPPAFAALG
jgi:putative acetyltransferase